MANVLYLVHRIPFPPDKGDKIRSWHLLRHLSSSHTVYLGAFVDDPADRQHEAQLKDHCAEVFLRTVGGWRSRFGAAGALLRRESLSVGYYRDARMGAWVSGMLDRVSIDAVVAFSSTMAQYFPKRQGNSPALVADFVDVDSDKWRQYAGETRLPRSAIYGYEARALAAWETSVLQRSDAVTVVSAAESRIVPGFARETATRIRVVPNGVDLEFFDPAGDWPDPYHGNRQSVIFTGAMDYHANVDGVCWFAEQVWPFVREACPEAVFVIVGSNPAAAVNALAQQPGITVTGRVADVRPWLSHAGVAVAPLRLARGVQNKVLEAMAMDLPVVARPEALRGLEGTLPDNVVAASSADEFARKLIERLRSAAATAGKTGRIYVRDRYSWERNLRRLDDLIPGKHANLDAGSPSHACAGA